MQASWTRIYTDADGETHFDAGSTPMELRDFAPPAPPLELSDASAAREVRYLGAPAGWDSDFHPAPRRQLVVMLRGLVEAATTDGEVRVFAPGDVVLLEDTEGTGHRTRIPGTEDWLAMVVVLG